jgi:hypothetical protein
MTKPEIYTIDNVIYQIVWKNEHEFGYHERNVFIQLIDMMISKYGKKWYMLSNDCQEINLSLEEIYQVVYSITERYYQVAFGDDFVSFESFSFDINHASTDLCAISFDGNGKQSSYL